MWYFTHLSPFYKEIIYLESQIKNILTPKTSLVSIFDVFPEESRPETQNKYIIRKFHQKYSDRQNCLEIKKRNPSYLSGFCSCCSRHSPLLEWWSKCFCSQSKSEDHQYLSTCHQYWLLDLPQHRHFFLGSSVQILQDVLKKLALVIIQLKSNICILIMVMTSSLHVLFPG